MATTREFEALARRRQLSEAELEFYKTQQRLSLPPQLRIPLGSILSLGIGFGLGSAQGSKMGGLRFRAEHAHKLPDTTTGWFLYHKSKNYHSAYSGVKEGFKMGGKVTFWTTAMLGIEAMFDEYRRTSDLLNTVTAAVTVAGCFSIWNGFSFPMAARTTKTALVVGLVYGGLQDAVGAAKGRHISYVEFLKRQLRSDSAQSPELAREKTL